MMHDLRFGFSPCPNDTFAFHALVNGLVECPVEVHPVMADIEELNRRAHGGELELTKLSFGALARLHDTYEPLRAGAALGRGAGPLLVARTGLTVDEAVLGPIAIPGRDTTANLLLNMWFGAEQVRDHGELVELRYDAILRAVSAGEVGAGLIIHESRFTYADHGLEQLLDLGEWWEARTGMPLPLAAICLRRDLDVALRGPIERALRDSVQHAFDHPTDSAAWVREHAQEMDEDVQRRHIELYVNEFTLDVGDEGAAAIDELLAAAAPA